MCRIVAGVMPSLYAARVTDSSAERNLASLLARAARKWPRLSALAIGARPLETYSSLAERSGRLAAALIAAGLHPGDRVAIASSNTPACVEALFAIWWAGLVAVPVNAKLHPRELGYVLSDAGARVVLTDPHWHDTLSSLVPAPTGSLRAVTLGSREYEAWIADADVVPIASVQSAAPAWLFYTSGTTGLPKGVVISHANLYAMTACFLTDVEAVAPGDAIFHAAPMSHGSGLYVLPHVARGAVHVVAESGGFDAAETRGTARSCSPRRRWFGD